MKIQVVTRSGARVLPDGILLSDQVRGTGQSQAVAVID
jgi:hypothetical protein